MKNCLMRKSSTAKPIQNNIYRKAAIELLFLLKNTYFHICGFAAYTSLGDGIEKDYMLFAFANPSNTAD